MTRTVQASRRAKRHLRAAARWWRDNREKNPDLFATELKQKLAVLKNETLAFVPLEAFGARNIYRVLMPETRHWLYFTIDDDVVTVLAIWHSSRGKPPDLGP